jgi:hypothetical protein
VNLEERQKHYTNWREFAERVAVPYLEADDRASDLVETLAADASKDYLLVALAMAYNQVNRLEYLVARGNRLKEALDAYEVAMLEFVNDPS